MTEEEFWKSPEVKKLVDKMWEMRRRMDHVGPDNKGFKWYARDFDNAQNALMDLHYKEILSRGQR